MYSQSPHCPVEKLPSPFYEAVIHGCVHTKAPPEVVVPDSFAVASAITQRRYKVRSFNGNDMPTTLNTLSLAPTAIGKGESYRMFFQAPGDWGVDEQIRAASATTIDDLLLQDVTPSALMSCLAGHGKSASIQLEDGYSFLDCALMKRSFISKLPQAWSGPPSLKFARHHGNKDAFEPCLGIGLRIQPELFYGYLRRDKCESRHLGLWPRFLTFCYDTTRFPVTPWYAASSTSMMGHLPLMERLQALLSTADAQPNFDQSARKVLVMDAHASAHLREIAYYVKSQMNGEFHDIQDAAGRAAENTLRLASNFHVVCQGEGPISREMIERAWAFVEWSLTQFRNVFVHALQPPPKPMKLKPMRQPRLPHHQQRLNADMQFVLDSIAARSAHFPNGRVPLADVALLAGFARNRFFKTVGWLITGGLVEIEGEGDSETIRDLSLQQLNAPRRYTRSALTY
jgi:hypothetical protein